MNDMLDHERRYTRVVWLLTVVAFCLRVPFISEQEPWWDEIITATRASMSFVDMLSGLFFQSPSSVHADCSPPLSHAFTHLFLLIDKSNFWLRMPSVLFGTLAIPVVYRVVALLTRNSMAGLYAAIFTTFSFFHVYYSREARWYSSFYFFLAVSALFFVRAFLRNEKKFFWPYVASLVAMSYTSYVAAVYILIFSIIYLVYLLVSDGGLSAEKRGNALRYIGAMVCIVILYAPWIPGQFNAYSIFWVDGARHAFSMESLLKILFAFIAPSHAYGDSMWVVIVLFYVGGAYAVGKRWGWGTLLGLAFFAVVPVVVAYTSKMNAAVLPRYTISLLPLSTCIAGAISSWCETLAVEFFRCRGSVGWLVGLSCVVVLSWPSIAHIQDIYRAYDKDGAFLPWMVEQKGTSEFLLLDAQRNFKATIDWFLPGLYKGMDEWRAEGYKRCLVMSGKSVAQEGDLPVGIAYFRRQGVLNRSPLVLEKNTARGYSYEDTYTDFRVLSDSSQLDNLAAETALARLGPSDTSRPGRVVYSFVNPGRFSVTECSVAIVFDLERVPLFTPDCYAEVEIASNDGGQEAVYTVDAQSFGREANTYRLDCLVPDAIASGDGFTVSIVLHTGKRVGRMTVLSFGVSNVLHEGLNFSAALDASGVYVDHIARLSNVVWNSRQSQGCVNDAVYGFDLSTGDGITARDAFLAKNTTAVKVYDVRSSTGGVSAEYYDPWLKTSLVPLRSDQSCSVVPCAPQGANGYVISGNVVFPELRTSDAVYPLFLRVPYASSINFSDNGRSTIVFKPLFDKGAFTPVQFDSYENIKWLPSSSITCGSEGPCSFLYKFTSAYPMKHLRIRSFPRMFHDADGNNGVRILISENGGDPVVLKTVQSDSSMSWKGVGPMYIDHDIKPETKSLDIIVEMTGDSVQMNSDVNNPMGVTISLDTSLAPHLAALAGKPLWYGGEQGNSIGFSPSISTRMNIGSISPRRF